MLYHLNGWTSWVNVCAVMFFSGKITKKRIILRKLRIMLALIHFLKSIPNIKISIGF